MPFQNQKLAEITDEVVRRVKEALGDKLYRIILFGSYARGDYDEESDVDIMVLENEENEERLEADRTAVWNIGWDVGGDYDIMVTVFLKDRQHFYEWMDAMAFYRNVEEEGIVLFEA
jgi:predicted nucleotidyltransferase